MRKQLIFLSLLIVSTSMFAQNLMTGNENLSTLQSQNSLMSIVSNMTPMDVPLDPDEYIIGAGDVFIVQIISTMTETFQLQVGLSDALTIPGYGQVDLSGQSLNSSIQLIEDLCKGTNKNVIVNVNLSDVKKLKIPIYGAVETPGMVTLPASSRLNEYLKKVTLHHLAKDFQVEIRSAGDTMIVNIYDYYLQGDLKSNPYLRSGESIYIPFADVETECVEVYGPVNSRSLIPLISGESVLEFIHRKIRYLDISDYSSVTITRHDKSFFKNIPVSEMKNYTLKAGDILEFSQIERIQVNGYVNIPGTYDYVPGHSVYDYIAMAGGANAKGNDKKIMVIRGKEKIRKIKDIEIQRGDIILVKRSAEDIAIGQISLLQFLYMIGTITTAFIAAYNSIN